MGERHDQFRQLKKDLSDIDVNRGGGPEKGLKGFYAEYINSTYSNIGRIDKGIAAREKVIDDNGDWDAVIKYATGSSGRNIQDKVGYSFSYYKNKISSHQYDNGVLRINPDNPIFSDERKLEELNKRAKEHGIQIVKGSVSEKEAKNLATVAGVEGKVRTSLGMKNKAPITAELYADSKEVSYTVENVHKKVTEVNEFIHDTTSTFISENVAKLNEAGLEQAASAAQFAAAMSIGRNAFAVIKGDEDLSDVAKEAIKDTTSAAFIGYATGIAKESLGISKSDASLLINGTIQISKQLIAYVDGDIDEEIMVKNIAEISVQLAAAYIGRMIGGSIGSIGGPIGIAAGQFIGEMISTAVCADLVSAIKSAKEIEKQNNKVIALYKNAEREIRASQERLEELIQKENNELLNAISDGMDCIAYGILNGSYDEIEIGLSNISDKFGLSLEELQKDRITKENLFDSFSDTIIFE